MNDPFATLPFATLAFGVLVHENRFVFRMKIDSHLEMFPSDRTGLPQLLQLLGARYTLRAEWVGLDQFLISVPDTFWTVYNGEQRRPDLPPTPDESVKQKLRDLLKALGLPKQEPHWILRASHEPYGRSLNY